MIAETTLPPIALHTLLNAIPGNHIFLLPDAPTFTIIGATDSLLKTSYTRREQIIGKPLFDVFTDNTANNKATGVSNFRASLNYVVDQKETHLMDNQRYDIINPDTGAFEVKIWAATNKPVLNTEGAIQYIIHTTTEITEKVRLQEESAAKEEKLKESENRFRLMVEQVPVAILLSRGDDVVIESINKPMLQFMNKTSVKEVVGKKMLEVLPELEDQEALQIVRNIQKTGIPFNSNEQPVEILIEGKPKRHFFNFSYTPIIEAGVISGVLHVAIDITTQVEARKITEESEARFKSIADQSPMIVFMVEPDTELRISYFNKTWLQYSGQSSEEALGRTWDGLAHPDDLKGVFELYVPAFEKQESYILPALRLRRHDGEYRWHYVKGTPRFLPTGEFLGYIGVGIDIHEQKLVTEAIKESEARAKAAIDIARLGTYEINVQEQTIIHSPRTAEILGLDPTQQWPYKTFINSVHPEDRDIRTNALEVAKRKGELFYEARIIRPDKNIRWVRLNGRFIQQDSLLMIIGTLMDITEERETAEVLEQKVEVRTKELEQVNEALKRSNQELKRSNTYLEEFAHAASHDMKEPIRKVLTFTDRLKGSLETRLTETEKRLFSKVENATARMGLLVDDLLEFSHVSERPLEKEEVDLNVIVKKVLTDLELLVEEKKAEVVVSQLPTINGYTRQLQQLLQNLTANALKYSKSNQAPVISVTSHTVYGYEVLDRVLPEQSGQCFHLIEVLDNGIGFKPEYAEKIFGMFQRLHGKADYPGTGVGLSIARKVVENHSGNIWAESQPGVGSTFKVLLPI